MGSGDPGGGLGGQPGGPKGPNWVGLGTCFGTGQNPKSGLKWPGFHRKWPGRYQNVEEDVTEPMAGSPGPGGPKKGPKWPFEGVWKNLIFGPPGGDP